MSDPDVSDYAQSLATSFTIDALILTFIFTALTLIVVETPDVTHILAQATLLVLMVAFEFALLSLSIIDMRMQMLRPKLKAKPPYTPGWRFHNLLLFPSIFLMSLSIILMMFYRGLTILGSVSVAIVVLTFAVYLRYISWYRLKWDQNK